MVFKAVENLQDLIVLTDVLVVEEFLNSLFKVIHHFNRCIAGSNGRHLIPPGSKLQEGHCEAADKEEVEEGYLVFGTGAGVSELSKVR